MANGPNIFQMLLVKESRLRDAEPTDDALLGAGVVKRAFRLAC